jgi:hypothetical protein
MVRSLLKSGIFPDSTLKRGTFTRTKGLLLQTLFDDGAGGKYPYCCKIALSF